MTAAAFTEDPGDNVLHLGGDKKRDTTGDVRQFVIVDDEDEALTDVLTAHRPKAAVLMKLARAASSDDEMVLMGVYDDFLDSVLDKESADYLRARFEDPEDILDLDHLDTPMKALVGLWYRRPTTKSAASSTRRPRSGRRSTVRQGGTD